MVEFQSTRTNKHWTNERNQGSFRAESSTTIQYLLVLHLSYKVTVKSY